MPVPAESLCALLLATGDGEERERLMAEAVVSPDCLDYALATAREQTASDPAQAGRLAALASSLAARRGDLRSESAALRVRAQAHRVEGAHADAATALETASGLALRAGDRLLAAQTLIGRVDSLGWLGRYEEALALARRLIGELRAQDAPEDVARVLVNLGSLHYRRDQYQAALDCYERAMDALSEAGDPVAVARVQANTANILMELNRIEEALRLFEQARDAFAQAGQATATAMVDANVGFLHYVSGRHSAAVAALTRARQEFAERGLALEAAKCEADMAEAYRELNLHPEALAAYESAIRHFEGVSVDYERARAEMGRASVLMAVSRPAEALEGLDRAEALFHAHRNSVRIAHVLLLRASFLEAEGRPAEAREAAARAATIFSRHRLRGWAAEARFLVAAAALGAGEDAVRAMHAVSRAGRAHGKGSLVARAESALGQYRGERGETTRALVHFRRGVGAMEEARALIAPEEMHVAFLRDKLNVYEQMVGALLARERPRDVAEALEIVERAKSRLLLERVQAALEGRTLARVASPDLESRLANLRAQLSREYHRLNALDEGEARRLGTASEGQADDLVHIEGAYRATLREAELADMDAGSGASPLPDVVGAAALQAMLPAKEALVEFYILGEQVCAFVLTNRQVRIVRDIASMAQVTFQARRLRFQLQRMGGGEMTERHAQRYTADAQNVLAWLYDLLLRPLEAALTAEKVVLVPYSGLHGLPFHAFFDGENYALDRWEFVYAPSAAVWYEGGRRALHSSPLPAGETAPSFRSHGSAEGAPQQSRRSGKGVPDRSRRSAEDAPQWTRVDAAWTAPGTSDVAPRATLAPSSVGARWTSPAPGTALLVGVPAPGIEKVTEEVERLSALLPGSVALHGDQATLEAFRAHAGCCGRIHLATHALYRSDNPLFSGLRFFDDWLLARDLYEMRLACDLATLSACHTGVSFVEAGDELFGLQRGFLAAGARSVAASLWLADDRATSALMEQFYAGLAQGMSKAAALRAAQQHTLRLHPHPYHWAAFVLIGER